jgi:hypothetical protein
MRASMRSSKGANVPSEPVHWKLRVISPKSFRQASWWFLRAFSHIEARLWVDARLAAMTLLRCGPDEVEVARAPSSIDSKALCARSRSFRT